MNYNVTIGIINNSIFITSGDSKDALFIEIPNKIFEDNSIVIKQGTIYSTQIIPSPQEISGRIVNKFDDAWHNTRENGLNNTIPTYYGDGTSWIKFKN